MDTLLEAQLTRMEHALSTLLTSIITYNPSLSAADELLHADDELSRGLETRTFSLLLPHTLPMLTEEHNSNTPPIELHTHPAAPP
jgi:hypothetical protein